MRNLLLRISFIAINLQNFIKIIKMKLLNILSILLVATSLVQSKLLSDYIKSDKLNKQYQTKKYPGLEYQTIYGATDENYQEVRKYMSQIITQANHTYLDSKNTTLWIKCIINAFKDFLNTDFVH